MRGDVDQKDRHGHINQAILQIRGGERADRIDHGLDAYLRRDLKDGLKVKGLGLTLCPHAFISVNQQRYILLPKIRKLWD